MGGTALWARFQKMRRNSGFISYSRDDLDFSNQLDTALNTTVSPHPRQPWHFRRWGLAAATKQPQ